MLNQPIDLTAVIQEFMAVTAPAGNALRNQERGVVRKIQEQLRLVDLDGVPLDSAEEYEQWLDARTEDILRALQVKIRPWGTVRKAINLFMRACICDHHLRVRYTLERVEPLAEMPLDCIVADALKREAGRGRLPVWPGLKHLDKEAHRKFQVFAAAHTKRLGLPARVYLDYYLWLRNR